MKIAMTTVVHAAVIVFLFLTGCAKDHTGLEVVRPKMTGHVAEGLTNIYSAPTTVESLKPILEWKPSAQAGDKYDVIVYQGLANDVPGGRVWLAGKRVYYREGLTANSHTVEEGLSPNTVYVWSVRTRSGTKVSPWSAYSDPWGDTRRHNYPYAFQTPAGP